MDSVETRLDSGVLEVQLEAADSVLAVRARHLETNARFQLARGRAYHFKQEYQSAIECFSRAIDLSETEPVTRAWAAIRSAQSNIFLDREEEAHRWVDQAATENATAASTRLQGEVVMLRARLALWEDDRDTAVRSFDEAQALFLRAGAPPRAFSALRFRIETEQDDESDDLHAEYKPSWRTLWDAAADWEVDPRLAVPAVIDLALEALRKGAQEGVAEILEEFTDTCDDLFPDGLRVPAGDVFFHQGDLIRARQHYSALAGKDGASVEEVWFARLHLASLDSFDGKGDAIEQLTQVVHEGDQVDVDAWRLIRATKLLADAGCPELAEYLCRRILGTPGVQAEFLNMAKVNLAGVCLTSGRIDEAARALDGVDCDHLNAEGLGVFRLNRASVARWRGSPEEADDQYRLGLHDLLEVGDQNQVFLALQGVLEVALLRGDVAFAGQVCDDLDSVGDQLPLRTRATTMLERGALLQATGEEGAALEMYSRCEAMASAGGDTRLVAVARLNAASLQSVPSSERYRIATEALRASRSNPQLQGFGHRLRGIAALELGNPRLARRSFRKAAAEFRKAGSPGDEADSWDWLARLETDARRAVDHAWRAFRLAGVTLSLIEAREDRLPLLARLRYVGAHLVECVLREGGAAQALPCTCKVKGGEFLGLALQTADGRNLPPIGVRQAMARAARLAATKHSGSVAFDPRVSRLPLTPGAALRNVALSVPMHAADARQMYRGLTTARGPVRDASVSLEKILRRLGPDEAAVEYFLVDPERGPLLLFVAENGRVRAVRRRWQRQHVDAVCYAVDVLQGRLEGDQKLVDDWLKDLHQVLVAPLGRLLDRTRRLWISPGGLLDHLPFEALHGESGPTLLQQIEVARLPTSAHLSLLPRRRKPIRTALVLRGADDGDTALRAADEECTQIRELFARQTQQRIRVLKDVKVDTLRRLDLLHYAGHATFDDADPDAAMLHLPGMPVIAKDIVSLSLEKRPLVVLSACETARVETGTDEFGGFVRAFFAAGARDVVCSGWKADDEITRRTMNAFYSELLGGDSPAVALRKAALEIRRDHPDPVHWANFRCYGVG